MTRNVEVVICLITLVPTLFLYLLNSVLLNLENVKNPPENVAWVVHGFRNILGYSTVFVPGYILYTYVKKTNYLNVSGRGPLGGLIRTCFSEDDLLLVNPTYGDKTARKPMENALLLISCFVGLLVSYVSWGLLQEKIMTQTYVYNEVESHFTDSQFLVFVNRVLAFIMACVVIFCTRQPRHRGPLYKYVYCSFSNIMSSWCQYEALKYVSFPHQVLAKASKTIPVMVMGRCISKTKYDFYEYVCAIILSLGMLFFMLDTGNDRSSNTITTFSGVILLVSYIAFDSFTANWQGKLFKTYEMKPVQMMCFVNFFSCIFTLISLLQHGGLLQSLRFMFYHPQFALDVFILSICSAVGQMFIYKTIEAFGPLVFVIISTIRQCLSILLSCIIYQHHVHVLGMFGLFLVFFSILLKIYCGHRLKALKQQTLLKS